MKSIYRVLLPVSFVALAACGGNSNAPVVYGANPSHDARVYNSHEEFIRAQEAAIAARRARAPQKSTQRIAMMSPPASAPTSQIEPVQLQQVSAVHLTETGEPAREPVSTRNRKFVAVVQPGDTVYAIGRRYDVTPQSIMRINNLRAPYHLEIGEKLRLPRNAKSDERQYAAFETKKRTPNRKFYTVQQGDTLYSISRESRTPVTQIATENGLNRPYSLTVGQKLALPRAAAIASLDRDNSSIYTSKAPPKPTPIVRKQEPKDVVDLARNVSYTPPAKSDSLFDWPVKGAIVANYGMSDLGRRNDGVNIAAPAGTPVRAAANGEVVYRGSELDGFGNLLLIKHTDGYVTAYAHNDAMLVKKGEVVRKGQVVAKVGQTGAVSSPQLHFEVRRNLKAVDPAGLLGEQ